MEKAAEIPIYTIWGFSMAGSCKLQGSQLRASRRTPSPPRATSSSLSRSSQRFTRIRDSFGGKNMCEQSPYASMSPATLRERFEVSRGALVALGNEYKARNAVDGTAMEAFVARVSPATP